MGNRFLRKIPKTTQLENDHIANRTKCLLIRDLAFDLLFLTRNPIFLPYNPIFKETLKCGKY